MQPEDRIQRMNNANALLQTIGSTGRKFFAHQGEISQFKFYDRNSVCFYDSGSKCVLWVRKGWGNRQFSEDGTLRRLVEALANYIRTGRMEVGHFGPCHRRVAGGNLWGYGNAMQAIRDRANELGITTIEQAE